MADPVNTGFDPSFGDPLRRWRAALAGQGVNTNVISGVRSNQAQKELYANWQAGRAGQPLPYPARGSVPLAAVPGTSIHERGLAADVEPTNPGDLQKMYALAGQYGLQPLGASDPYHFQLRNWQQAEASQPAPTPWDQSAPRNVPSQYASNVSAGDQPAGGNFAVPPGGTLSPGQIYQLAIKHGFAPGQEATTATAIALGESSGNSGAFNPKDSHGGSVGLMQINGANAGLIGGDNWKTAGTDPNASMAAAYQLFSKRGNFNDWGSYTNGSYKDHLNQAAAAASAPNSTNLTTNPITNPGPMDPSAQARGSTVNPAIPDAAPQQNNPFQNLFTRPPPTKDAQGNDVQGKSPVEKIAGSLGKALGGEKGQQQAAAPQPAQFAPVQDPMAQMAGPAAQLYSTVQAQAAKPLSWSSRPYGWDAGLQMAPGMSLNTTGYG